MSLSTAVASTRIFLPFSNPSPAAQRIRTRLIFSQLPQGLFDLRQDLADARLSGGSRQSGGSGSDENDAQAPLSALRALSAASQLRRRIRDSGQPGLGQGTRNPRRGLCQEGSTESLRDGAFQLGLSAVAAFPSWNRGLHLDAQASLRCRSLHLEGLGAFSAVPASFGLSFNLLVLARLRL